MVLIGGKLALANVARTIDGGRMVSRRYVLWTDEDNLKLVQRYYPEFLQIYMALPAEIYRADMVGTAINSSFPSLNSHY
jgi:hypothetical protein